MNFNDWLNMLRLVFGQGVVKFFRSTPSGLTLHCRLKMDFVIEVTQINGKTVAVVNERSYRPNPTWLDLLKAIDDLYNQ